MSTKRAYMLLQTLVLDFKFEQCIYPGPPAQLKCWLSRLNASYEKDSHSHISTRVRFGNQKETPARAFSHDEVRIADYFEENLFDRRWSDCRVSEGVGFTEEPRIEL